MYGTEADTALISSKNSSHYEVEKRERREGGEEEEEESRTERGNRVKERERREREGVSGKDVQGGERQQERFGGDQALSHTVISQK